MAHPLSIGILGGGESGVGAALLAKHRGIPCFLSEGKQLGEAHRAELHAAGIDFEEGGHDLERLCAFEVVVKSPGISPALPVVQALKLQASKFGPTSSGSTATSQRAQG